MLKITATIRKTRATKLIPSVAAAIIGSLFCSVGLVSSTWVSKFSIFSFFFEF
jgi:hypothetical protein